MKRYDDLTPTQRQISNKIEKFFIENEAIQQYDFTIALAFLLNKYKKVKV